MANPQADYLMYLRQQGLMPQGDTSGVHQEPRRQDSYLDYWLSQMDQDTPTQAGDNRGQPNIRPTPPGYAALLTALAHGAQRASANPNRQPAQVQLQDTGNPLQGLFGGGSVAPLPVVAPPGWDVPQTTAYEDGSFGVPNAPNDPMLMLFQKWLGASRMVTN